MKAKQIETLQQVIVFDSDTGKLRRDYLPAPTAPSTVKARITRAVNQSRITGDWSTLENIIPTTAHTNRNRGERIHTHKLTIHNPDFKILGIGQTNKVVIVIGNRQITRTINPNPTPYTQTLAITTDPQQVNHYTPISGLTQLANTHPTLNPNGTITQPTHKPNTQTTNPTKPNTKREPTRSLVSPSRGVVYSPLSRNRRKSGRVSAPAGSLRDLAKKRRGA